MALISGFALLWQREVDLIKVEYLNEPAFLTAAGWTEVSKCVIRDRAGATVRVRDTESGANGALPRTSFADPVRTDPSRIQAKDTPSLDPSVL